MRSGRGEEGAGSCLMAPLNSSQTGAFLGWGAVCAWRGVAAGRETMEAVHAFVQT